MAIIQSCFKTLFLFVRSVVTGEDDPVNATVLIPGIKMQFDYDLNQRVPILKSLLLGLQWAAILISSIIILGKVIGALHYSDAMGQILYLQKILFLCAVTLFCQVFWGHKLPVAPGPAAVLFVGILASQGFGIQTIYSSLVIGGGLIAVLSISGLFKYLQKFFTSNVIAVVLLLITFTIAPTIRNLMIDSQNGIDPVYNMGFSLSLVFVMLLLYGMLSGIWRATLMIWGMIFGSLCYFLIFHGSLAYGPPSDIPLFNDFFEQMNFHFSFQPGVLISFLFCYIALSINDLGSIQAVNEMLKPGDEGGRITRGIAITGVANIAAGFFGVIGPVNYTISPGVIVSTRCASQFVLLPAAAVMFLLAFFPTATGFIGSVPSPVIGAVLAYVMVSQIASGLMVAFKGTGGKSFAFEDGMVIGLSILLGTIVAFLPSQVVNGLPPFLRPILGNGFVVGVVSALIMEHLVVGRKPKREP